MSNKTYLHKSVGLHKHSKRCFSPTQTELCFYILLTHVYIIYMCTYYKHRDVYITVLVQFHFPQRKQLLYLTSNTITHVVVINYESRKDKEFLSPCLQPSSARWWWQLGLWEQAVLSTQPVCPSSEQGGLSVGLLITWYEAQLPAEAWQPPLPSHLLPMHSLLPACTGYPVGFFKAPGPDSWLCKLTQLSWDGAASLHHKGKLWVLQVGVAHWLTQLLQRGCQHVPPHVSFPGNLHHYRIYLLLLTFTVKKKRISKETASQDRQDRLPIGTGRAHWCR